MDRQISFKSKIINPNFSKNSNFADNNLNNSSINNNSKLIIQKVKNAKASGILNISNLNLTSLPKEIFDENAKFEEINWWEVVDIKKLDATNNLLCEQVFIDNDNNNNFNSLPNLVHLKFSNNKFNCIPDSIFVLYNLKYLDFSDNKISFISDEIKNLKSLVELNLSGNVITKIPDKIGFLLECEILNLSKNKITDLNRNISKCVKLKKLDLSDNLIQIIPELNNLYLLEELNLHSNKIKIIEKNAFNNLINLKYIDLHINQLEELSSIPLSDKLDTLILGYNRLTNINNLINAPNLTVLDINNNKIEVLPKDILSLKHLKTLNLQNNSFNDIPPQICFLTKLVRINLEGNPLKKINNKYRSANAEQLKQYLKTRLSETEYNQTENQTFTTNNSSLYNEQLNNEYNLKSYIFNNCLKLSNCNLKEIPVEALFKSKLESITTLDFSNNSLTNINCFYSLNSLNELIEINFSNNKINLIPETLANYYNLKIINFKNNNISSFLDGIFNNNYSILPNLEYLDLSMNKFNKIPLIILSFKKLNCLLISNNFLSDLEVFTANVNYSNYNLEILDLSNNKIIFLNQKLYKIFPNLKALNLENNEIKQIPTDLCLLNLNKLSVIGNPIKQLRSNILHGGTNLLIDYLKKMHNYTNEDIEFSENKQDINLPDNLTNELDRMNNEILDLEQQLANSLNMPVYKKTELKRRLTELIINRSKLTKKS